MVQQSGHRPAPDFFYSFLSEKQFVADAIFNVESAAGDGDVNVWMLITGVQGAEVTALHALFAGPVEHGAGGSAEERIQQRPVVTEEGPEQVRHGKRDVLPVAVGENMALLRNPLLRGFKSVTAAGF